MARIQRSRSRVWLGLGAATAALGVVVKWQREQIARRNWRWWGHGGSPGVALVTGASSGIGASFARRLAAHGHPLVLVARRADRLEAIASELRQQHGVDVETLPADLADADGLARVATRIEQLDRLELLVNNAGFGITDRFANIEAARLTDMIELHAIASTRLLRAALPGMLARRHGGIINVSSAAAFFALPRNANYSATKAYLNVLTQTLHFELRGSGVRVQALCPGLTRTEFHQNLPNFGRERLPRFLWLSADEVVAASLDALERDVVICVPGLLYKVMAAVGRTGMVTGLAGRGAMLWYR